MSRSLLPILISSLLLTGVSAHAEVDKQIVMCRFAYLQSAEYGKIKSFKENEIQKGALLTLSNDYFANRCNLEMQDAAKALKLAFPAKNKCIKGCDHFNDNLKDLCQFSNCAIVGDHTECAETTCDKKADDFYFSALNCYTSCSSE